MAKKILVTGGSRGIGAASVIKLAEMGYDICFTYRTNEAEAKQITDQVLSLGQSCLAIQMDVAEPKSIEDAFAKIDQDFGQIDGLVNNAGIVFQQMKLVDMDLTRIQKIFNVNMIGTILVTQHAIKRMGKSYGGKGGSIVNLSSMAARLGSPFEYIDYAASKGGIDTLTIGLAKEIADEGVRVNGVRPGLIETDMHADGGEAGRVDRLGPSVPLGRGGKASEVANAIAWLISDEASYCTGTFIDCSGGR